MTVLTAVKRVVKGNYTYELMSNDMIHINNHKTNNKSVIVPLEPIRELLSSEEE